MTTNRHEEKIHRAELLKQGKNKCTVCYAVKSVAMFHRNKQQQWGISSICKVCTHKRRVAWYQENATHARDYSKAWARAHSVQVQQRALAWNRAHPIRRREIVRTSTRKRRAKKQAVHEQFTTEMERFVFQFWGSRCAVCGETKNCCIDHWHPLSRGNGLTITNAVLLCLRCNSKKHAKLPDQHYTPEFVETIRSRLSKQEQQWLALPLTLAEFDDICNLDAIGVA